MFFARQFYSLYKHKFSNLRPLLCITFLQGFQKYKKFGHWSSGSGGKKMLNRVKKNNKNVKDFFFCRGDFTSFMSKSYQIWDPSFLLLFPKDSENLKSLDIGLRKVGAKRPLNGVRNTDTKKSCSVRQKLPKNKLFLARQFYTLY